MGGRSWPFLIFAHIRSSRVVSIRFAVVLSRRRPARLKKRAMFFSLCLASSVELLDEIGGADQVENRLPSRLVVAHPLDVVLVMPLANSMRSGRLGCSPPRSPRHRRRVMPRFMSNADIDISVDISVNVHNTSSPFLSLIHI